MKQIPVAIRKNIADNDPGVRESAAWQLRGYPGPGALRYLKNLLRDDHAEVCYAAVAGIVAIGGEAAVEAVLPLLRSQNVRLRNTAVEILARIGTAAIDRIADLLHDRDKDIRKFGVDILEKIGSTDAEAPLVQALLDDNINVSAAAAEALGKCGTASAVTHLVACLDRSAWLKCAALRSLGAIGGDAAFKAIIGVSPQEESMVLFSAVTALGVLGDSRGIDFLLLLLEQADPTLEPAIMQAIESIFSKSYVEKLTRVSQKIDIGKILPMLESDNRETVRSAIGLLGLLRAENAVEALVKLFTEANRGLLEDLEQALLQIKPNRIQPLIAIMENNREPDSVKRAAIRILGAIGRSEALDPLVSCLETAGESLKSEIIQAMAVLGDPQAIRPLEALLCDPSEPVRLAAIAALAAFRSASSISALLGLKTDRSETVRSAAATSLATHDLTAFKADIQHLLGARDPDLICFGLEALPASMGPVFESDILKLCGNENSRVKKQAVKTAGRLQSDAAIARIVGALSDTDDRVRLAAIRAINGKDAPNAAACLIKLATSDSSAWNRYEAVQTICRMKFIRLRPQLLDLLETGPELVQAAVIDTLGAWGHPESKPIMHRYALSDNDVLRQAALKALDNYDG